MMHLTLRTAMVAMLAVGLASAVSMANPKQRGKSNTATVDLSPNVVDFGQSGRVVNYRTCPDEEGMVHFTLHADGLAPGSEHEVRSGGNVIASGTSNPQGKLRIAAEAHVDELGARFNVWGPEPDDDEALRLLTSEEHGIGEDCD